MFKPSKQLIVDACSKVLGTDYFLVHSVSLQATHLVVFASLRLASIISDVRSSHVSLGYGGNLGNKGGCSVTMTVGATRLCFVSCHLHSKQHGVEKRNLDFQQVVAQLVEGANGKEGQKLMAN